MLAFLGQWLKQRVVPESVPKLVAHDGHERAATEAPMNKPAYPVAETLKKADAVWWDLIKLIQAEYAGDTKTMLLVRYTDLVFEHHKAIRHLVEAKMYGAAFALVRVLFDGFFRAHWMLLCATDDQTENIATSDEGVFPRFHRWRCVGGYAQLHAFWSTATGSRLQRV